MRVALELSAKSEVVPLTNAKILMVAGGLAILRSIGSLIDRNLSWEPRMDPARKTGV